MSADDTTTPAAPAPLLFDASGAPVRKKQEVLHRKKFMDGKETPNEVSRRLGIAKRCSVCGGPGAIRIRVFMPYDEAMKRAPDLMAAIMVSNPDGLKVPTVTFKDGTTPREFIKASDNAFCDNCKVEAERVAGQSAPSWAVVEIDRGVKDTVQVGA
jgi:hypothetical protein